MRKSYTRAKTVLFPLALLAAICAAAAPASGSLTFTTVPGSDADGILAATAMFTPENGGLEITLTNTLTGSNATALAKGQAISDLSFTLNNGLTATNFTMLTGLSYTPSSGVSWTLANGTSFSDTSSAPPVNAIDHWGFQASGGSVLLATAGSPVPGAGNAHFMILPSSGTAGTGSSLANSNFSPYIIGPANFFISVPGLSSSSDLTNGATNSSLWDVTNVDVSFGTAPDANLITTGNNNGPPPPGAAVPEPVSLIVWAGISAMAAGAAGLRKRKAVGRWSEANRAAVYQVIGWKPEG